MPDATYHFPPDFRWGVATASHQVEGNNRNNQWWAWEHEEPVPSEVEGGRIAQGHKSGLACNWWENAEVDFELAAKMGLNAMRLSIEWSRVEPKEGYVDLAVIERYRAMLQNLHERGIEPMITLHHFSDPLWLAERGGWEDASVIPLFNRYAELTVKHLGDLTDLWCTINEPNVYIYMGYVDGVFPPGKQDFGVAMKVLRNMIKAHAMAYKTIHRLQPDARVGLAHNLRFFDPARPDKVLDRLVAWAQDLGFNRTTLDPLIKGWWVPPLGFGPALGVARTMDWIGMNYYTRDLVIFDREAKSTLYGRATHTPDAEMLDGDYGELYPEGLYRGIKYLASAGLPIYITENGIPDADDDQRPRALVLHLHQLWKALQQSHPVMGYYHWTLTDNFEWAEGWTLPFGLIELDPQTQERSPRPSADLYAAIARGNAITPELVDAYVPELRPILMPG